MTWFPDWFKTRDTPEHRNNMPAALKKHLADEASKGDCEVALQLDRTLNYDDAVGGSSDVAIPEEREEGSSFAAQMNHEEYADFGTSTPRAPPPMECECCFVDELLPEECAQCQAGHVFCKPCVAGYVSNLVGGQFGNEVIAKNVERGRLACFTTGEECQSCIGREMLGTVEGVEHKGADGKSVVKGRKPLEILDDWLQKKALLDMRGGGDAGGAVDEWAAGLGDVEDDVAGTGEDRRENGDVDAKLFLPEKEIDVLLFQMAWKELAGWMWNYADASDLPDHILRRQAQRRTGDRVSHPTSSGSDALQQQRQWLPLDEIEREMVRECFVTENQREGWAALKEYRSSVLEYKKAETMTAELCPFCGQQAVRRPAPDIPRLPKRTDPDPVTAVRKYLKHNNAVAHRYRMFWLFVAALIVTELSVGTFRRLAFAVRDGDADYGVGAIAATWEKLQHGVLKINNHKWNALYSVKATPFILLTVLVDFPADLIRTVFCWMHTVVFVMLSWIWGGEGTRTAVDRTVGSLVLTNTHTDLIWYAPSHLTDAVSDLFLLLGVYGLVYCYLVFFVYPRIIFPAAADRSRLMSIIFDFCEPPPLPASTILDPNLRCLNIRGVNKHVYSRAWKRNSLQHPTSCTEVLVAKRPDEKSQSAKT